jgi:iron(III) transport system permease protein
MSRGKARRRRVLAEEYSEAPQRRHGSSCGARRRREIPSKALGRALTLGAALLFALIGLVPIALMLARVGGDDLAAAFHSRTALLLARTLWVGGGSALLALALGMPYGFLVARTDLPGAGFLRALGLLPLLAPPLVLAMTLTVTTGARGGLAIPLVLGLGTFPLVALYTARALERIDGRMEEAARLAGGVRALLLVQLPLALPSAAAAACFAFVLAINDFAVPDYVSSIGVKFPVYADEVFASWRSAKDTGRAVAAALPIVLLTLLALVPALRLARGTRLVSLVGDFRRPEPLALGRARPLALVFVAAVLALGVALPVGRLVWEAGGGPRGFGLGNVRAAFARALELGRSNLQSSLLYAAGAALLCMPLGLVLGHALARAHRWSRAAGMLVILPFSVPAILFGIGSIALWNRPLTGALYDSGWMAVVLLVGRFAPFAVLALASAAAMLDPRLEEAARLAGAGPLRRLACIVAPAILPALLGAGVLVFVLALRELDAVILVPAANSMVLFRLYNAVHFGRDDFVAALALLVVFFVVLPGLLHALFGRRRLEILP